MPRKRSTLWRGEEEAEVQIVSDDEGDANADLSMGIIAKASHRNASSLGALIVLSDDDQPSIHMPVPSSPITKLPPFTLPEVIAPQREQHPGKKQNKKKKKTTTVVTEATQVQLGNVEVDGVFKLIADDGEDNLEMRKLLRGPRYFDLPDQNIKNCFRCGNTGHTAAQCTGEARKKACYVCGSLDHEVKDCPQGSCFICKGNGHFAKSCPNKGMDNYRGRDRGNFCLRCGYVGHEMEFCDRKYDPEDLKGIQCYVCKEYGHLCCVDVALTSDRQDTCYNCGEVGHTGMGCTRSRVHIESDKKPGKVCYRCGEAGHFARGCSKRDEADVWDDFGTPTMRRQSVETDFQGFRSVPAIVEARLRRDSQPFYERHFEATTVVRWPERWNMEDERWHGGSGKTEHKHRRFTDHRKKGHISFKSRGKQRSKKDSKCNKFHGSGEAGSSTSSNRRHRGE